ncbi:MAG: D-alanine--D-alanine ligase [Saprospiraceae bacterium]|nr:D-alanine--D-alanine ligase [Saprospiraceae bacterium]
MIKTGIFFGGPSREREISFAGGRTVYDNLDKSLFEPVPIFIDSNRKLVLLEWPFVYKGTIRDFYPPVEELPQSEHHFQIYIESLGPLSPEEQDRILRKIGRPITLDDLPELIDIAFLALHGEYGEDGQLQGQLEGLQIPYTGSGIRACAIGMDKAFQKKIMEAADFACPDVVVLERKAWIEGDQQKLFEQARERLGNPLVIRPANQGSSIGVTILQPGDATSSGIKAINRAFFRERLSAKAWNSQTLENQISYLRELTDIRSGLGFPVEVEGQTVYHPEALFHLLNQALNSQTDKEVILESHLSEQRVILEAFIRGKEFSCIVLRKETGEALALPPTEIVKGGELFDYQSKYLPGMSRKLTPIGLPDAQILEVQQECIRLFEYLEFQTYARIDGFITGDGIIYLNDPNTTSGMLPSSFFFHQAAEIGLTPSQFLTYILRCSAWERMRTAMSPIPYQKVYEQICSQMDLAKSHISEKQQVAIILGGYSFERHISVESGRNIFEKLASSEKYAPIPVFLLGDDSGHRLFQIPINLLLKDNADDIRDKILHFKKHPIIEQIKTEAADIIKTYVSSNQVFEPQEISYSELAGLVDAVFIALHGRPGEDGEVQKRLEQVGLPYNGSNADSSGITINKYETLQLLKAHGFTVTDQVLLYKEDYQKDAERELEKAEARLTYPIIAKPVDDGCSSAVLRIRDRQQLTNYLEMLFRNPKQDDRLLRQNLKLDQREEFPIKQVALLEALISPEGAKHFMEITGGLLTHATENGLRYELFEPSEALATGDVLSLQEKFLAGEGQNITPARFSSDPNDYAYIAQQVKKELERAAKILNIKGYARIDAFVRIFEDLRAETIIVEVNSLPGMTPATCIYHQAAINGYKPYHFIDKILEFGFHEREANSVVE